MEYEYTSTEYEQLTQTIYQKIIDKQGLSNISVEHNVKVVGASGAEHQIDVLWEHQVAGKKYKTFIECKQYHRTVEIGHIRNFFGVLTDTSATGIFVTKVGYQSGAQKFAKHYDIDLKLVKPIEVVDFEGRVQKIKLDLTFKIPAQNPPPEVDFDLDPKDREFLLTLSPEQLSGINSSHFVDGVGKPWPFHISQEISRRLNVLSRDQGGPYEEHVLLNDAFISISGRRIKVDGFRARYHVVTGKSESMIDGMEIFEAILKDYQSGDIEFFKKKSGN